MKESWSRFRLCTSCFGGQAARSYYLLNNSCDPDESRGNTLIFSFFHFFILSLKNPAMPDFLFLRLRIFFYNIEMTSGVPVLGFTTRFTASVGTINTPT
jgi:hypothetical protein